MPLTTEEQNFFDYWQSQRLKEKKTYRKIAYGISSGIIFSGVILLSWVSGWNRQVYKISWGLFITVLIGLLGVAIFFAYFKMQLSWDKKEHYFNLLKAKKENEKQH